MEDILWERYPLVSQSTHGQKWLAIQSNLGLSPHTIDAYGRALEDYLTFSHRCDVAIETATKEHIAVVCRINFPYLDTNFSLHF